MGATNKNSEVRAAIRRGEFVPHFQPLIHLRTGDLHGFEMLARWHHPTRGMVPPDEFIPVAVREGWIGELTDELLRQAFRALHATPERIRLSVNLSPVQLQDSGLPVRMAAQAAACDFPLSRVTVEITESALTHDPDAARRTADQLYEMGCKLSLDDFGTGYSSLTQLQSLPFHELKVDRSFVRTMHERRDSRKIVAAVVGLGRSLGLITVAEGVESEEDAEKLRWMGCELGQGWLFGVPRSAEELPTMLQNYGAGVEKPGHSVARDAASSSVLEWIPWQRVTHLPSVYDNAAVGLAFLDRQMRYVYLNRKLAEMNGRPILDHLGRPVQEMIPEVFPFVEGYIRAALAGQSIPGVEVIRPAVGSNPSRTLLVNYEPVRDESGEVVGVSVALTDMTSIRHAREALCQSEEHSRNMLELMSQIPWILDKEGRVLDLSKQWLALAGAADGQWQGHGWLEFLHPEDKTQVQKTLQEHLVSGEPIEMSYRLRPASDASWIWVHSRGAARRNADGEIIGWYGSLEEIEPGGKP